MRTVTCPCGTQFEASSPRATYCSPTCRKRGSRAGVVATQRPAKLRPTPVQTPAPTEDPVVEVPTVTGAVIADLAESNALQSPAGLAAVRLAQLIDSATLMAGSSAAAWVREMRAALAEAKSAAPSEGADPLDELEKRRARRGA